MELICYVKHYYNNNINYFNLYYYYNFYLLKIIKL